MKIIHAADLHIDSGLSGLPEYEGRPDFEVAKATRLAFENLIQLCIDEEAALLLLAGDVFDGNWRDWSTGLFFEKQLARLQSAGTRVFIVKGNHDSENEITKRLPPQPHVHIFSHRKADTVLLEEHRIAVHGMSFPKRAVSENLVPDYPPRTSGYLNIGVLHTNATNSTTHDTYAPCTVAELVAKEYDYWALGHIHNREVLNRNPFVVYSGNLQGRHIKEQGPKGCVILTVEDGAVQEVEFRDLDVVRWFNLDLPVAPSETEGELHERLKSEFLRVADESEGRVAAVRVCLTGDSLEYHRWTSPEGRDTLLNSVRGLASHVSDSIWIESLRFDLRPAARATEETDGFFHQLEAIARRAQSDPVQLSGLAGALDPLRTKVGMEVEELGLGEPDQQRRLLEKALDRVTSRLLGDRR